ncbi:hypothetical protein E2C01_083615 [Portunus trituberculatus]|uniref:Uncharacterized protein n=1 Tax=Portunus trituberculatus TaxID=210409 RepID=A0A5B7J3Z5_PORTR|nr:hypothetical protein [Portunus trituberculatus]
MHTGDHSTPGPHRRHRRANKRIFQVWRG